MANTLLKYFESRRYFQRDPSTGAMVYVREASGPDIDVMVNEWVANSGVTLTGVTSPNVVNYWTDDRREGLHSVVTVMALYLPPASAVIPKNFGGVMEPEDEPAADTTNRATTDERAPTAGATNGPAGNIWQQLARRETNQPGGITTRVATDEQPRSTVVVHRPQ